MRLVGKLVMNVNLSLDVHHEIFLDDLIDTHALEHNDTLGKVVTSDGHDPDHATSD